MLKGLLELSQMRLFQKSKNPKNYTLKIWG